MYVFRTTPRFCHLTGTPVEDEWVPASIACDFCGAITALDEEMIISPAQRLVESHEVEATYEYKELDYGDLRIDLCALYEGQPNFHYCKHEFRKYSFGCDVMLSLELVNRAGMLDKTQKTFAGSSVDEWLNSVIEDLGDKAKEEPNDVITLSDVMYEARFRVIKKLLNKWKPEALGIQFE